MIRIEDLTLTYDRHPAVHHLTGQFQDGSLTAIVGPNGAGKSTLLKAIAGLLSPALGKLDRQGLVKGDMAYLPQQAEIDRSFPISVFDMVLMGRWKRLGIFGSAQKTEKQAVLQALEAVGLEGFERRMIAQLSAGQMQRVLFARLMVQEACVILLDEPFNAIDARTTADLLDLVTRWHGEARTIIAVLHDLEQVRRCFPETLLMAREGLAWGATASVLTPANLAIARSRSEAWDEAAAACRRTAA